MTNQHPITPPAELIIDWCKQRACISEPGPIHIWLATEAARWGADQQLKSDAEQIAQAYQAGANQELDACVAWLEKNVLGPNSLERLRAARRPKPPSLKEQALEELENMVKAAKDFGFGGTDPTAIRRALEALPND